MVMKQTILVLVLALFILTTGCLGSDEPLTTEACSNSRYSTINLTGQVDYPYVTLTQESERKLENNIAENGSSALQGATDLDCLTWLDLSGYPLADVTPLAQLENLRYLDLAYTPVSDTTPLSSLNKLEVLNLVGTNISREECMNLDKRTDKTKVICPG